MSESFPDALQGFPSSRAVSDRTIDRPRLLRRIKTALRASHVCITAPPGYGKSMLLRSLAAERPQTHYILVTAADADLPHLEARIAPLVQKGHTLLFDDVQHLAHAPEVVARLEEWMRMDALRLVLSGRAALDLPSGLDANRIFRLDASDLAFTVMESWALLTARYSSQDAIGAWHTRTGGWPLALALLARQDVPPEPDAALQSAQDDLIAYLAGVLTATLPPDIQRFLRVTAAPLRFNDDLAASLLGDHAQATELRVEVQRRNLFLESAEQPGWYHYHALVRDFLLTHDLAEQREQFRHVVAWFEGRDDLEMAIEHALAGALEDEAVRLLKQVPISFVWNGGRYRTYRRWILSLDPATRDANTDLQITLAKLMHDAGWWDDGRAYLTDILHQVTVRGDDVTQRQIRTYLALFAYREGHYETALASCRALLDDPRCDTTQRLLVLRIASMALSETARFQEARRIYNEALLLSEALGDEDELVFNRHNLVTGVLVLLGDYVASQALLEANTAYYEGRPGLGMIHIFGMSELFMNTAQWDRLAATLEQHGSIWDGLEDQPSKERFWLEWYHMLLAIGQQRLADAEALLDGLDEQAAGHPERIVCLGWGRAWWLRRSRRAAEAVTLADSVLAQPLESPFHRALLALERMLAQVEAQDTSPTGVSATSLSPLLPDSQTAPEYCSEVANLLRWRARPQIMRLHALTTYTQWRAGDRRWRRHAHAVLRVLKRPGYEHLLTQRDPELGSRFWSVLLAEGVEVARAQEALRVIGDSAPIVALLRHPAPTSRARAGAALLMLGKDDALPALTEALRTERVPATLAVLEAAVNRLERLPPPALNVNLMGTFAVRQGGVLLPDDVWPRPIVRRLFQYFVLHRREPLARDRILDDLWPETEPEAAWSTFRTVYSRLRSVLEPSVRPKAPSRYVAVAADTYQFDPGDQVQVDTEIFEHTISSILSGSERDDIPPLPTHMLDLLEGWAPLLPSLPYEEWLLEPRERHQSLYIEGCSYVAQAMLLRNQLREAITWAERAIVVAPWLEEAYQLIMRAYARLGQRSRALRAFADAREALEREFGVAPAPLTAWLAERLQQGEEI